MLASYERNFPLKDLEPVFREIEAARKEAEKARDAAKKGKAKEPGGCPTVAMHISSRGTPLGSQYPS